MIITDMPHVTTKNQIVNALGYEPPVEDTQGVNLIPGTKDFSGYWQTISLWTKDGEYDGLTVYSKNTPWGRLSSYINVVSGEIYTFSAWVKSNAPNEFIRLTTDGGWSTPINPGLEGYIQNEWCRVKCVLKSVKTGQVYFGIETTSESENYKVSVCGYKLERGTVTNPVWTPAPEDVVVRSELEALIERVAALETKTSITSADSMELPSMDAMESGSETASADDAEDDMEIN